MPRGRKIINKIKTDNKALFELLKSAVAFKKYGIGYSDAYAPDDIEKLDKIILVIRNDTNADLSVSYAESMSKNVDWLVEWYNAGVIPSVAPGLREERQCGDYNNECYIVPFGVSFKSTLERAFNNQKLLALKIESRGLSVSADAVNGLKLNGCYREEVSDVGRGMKNMDGKDSESNLTEYWFKFEMDELKELLDEADGWSLKKMLGWFW